MTISDAAGGTVSLNPQFEQFEGKAAWPGTAELSVTPDPGYELESLTVAYGDSSIAATRLEDNLYSFKMPGSAVTVTPVFAKIKYGITIAMPGDFSDVVVNATVNGQTVSAAEEGAKVELVCQTPGYTIFGGTYQIGDDNPKELSTPPPYSFTMPESAVTVNPSVGLESYSVTAVADAHYTIELYENFETCDTPWPSMDSDGQKIWGPVQYGSTLDLSVTAAEGYTLTAIKVNGTAISFDGGDHYFGKLTVTGETTIVVTYVQKQEGQNP